MKQQFILFLIILFSVNSFGQEQLEVFFDFNKSEINESARQKLETWIAVDKDVEVSKIYGYCDWKGSNPYNDTLSLKRVDAVYKFLKNKNITVLYNYEVKGFGKDFKQSKIQSENRKVTIYFQKKKAIIPTSEENKTLDERVKKAKKGDILILKNIYFLNRSAKIVPESKPVLYELLCVLEENPNLKIQIQGHICCQLVSDFEDISTARARAIYVFLAQNKINRKRLSFKGFGVSKPIHPIPEKTEQEADENRRVEIMILEN